MPFNHFPFRLTRQKQTEALMPLPVDKKEEMVLESTVQAFAGFNHFIYSLKEKWSIDSSIFTNIHVALSEAVMNALVHGNHYSGEKHVYITAYNRISHYAFTVEDEGAGFDHRSVADPVSELRADGRGIFIMNHLSDITTFTKEGKKLELKFMKR